MNKIYLNEFLSTCCYEFAGAAAGLSVVSIFNYLGLSVADVARLHCVAGVTMQYRPIGLLTSLALSKYYSAVIMLTRMHSKSANIHRRCVYSL